MAAPNTFLSQGVTRLCRQWDTWFVLLEERSPLQQNVQTRVASLECVIFFNGDTLMVLPPWQLQYDPLSPALLLAVPVCLALYGSGPSPGDPIPR